MAAGHPYLGAEVAYAVTHEGALHVEDVLVRRIRLFIEAGAWGAEAVGPVADLMGDLLGWDAAGGPRRPTGTWSCSRPTHARSRS